MSSVVQTGKTRLNIIPKESVKLDNQIENVEKNLSLISDWLPNIGSHGNTAFFASAGPSLDRLLSNGYIHSGTFKDTGSDLFCVKHALPILAKHGLVPRFCVVLDPRDLEKESTHGVLRKSLFEAANPGTTFLVSSSTSPTVTEYLLKRNLKVVGWHASVQGLETFKPQIPYAISGGTCAATRGLLLAHFMGYRKARLLGYDSSLDKEPLNPHEKVYFDEEVNWNNFVDYKKKTVDWDGAEKWINANSNKNTAPKYFQIRIKNSKMFWTTGELAAQLQDLERFLTDKEFPLEIKLIGCDKESHAAGALYDAFENQNATIKPLLREVFGD